MKHLFKTAITLTLVATMLSLTLIGCGEKKRDSVIAGYLEQNTIENESTEFSIEFSEESKNHKIPDNFESKSLVSLNTLLLELNANKIDYLGGIPKCTGEYISQADTSLSYVESSTLKTFHMGIRPDEKKLRDDINEAINKLNSYGKLEKIIDEYITNATGDPIKNTLANNPDGETYVVGVTGDMPPMDFVSADGTPAGFNVALLNAISELTGWNFKIVQIEANARMTALASDKIDIIFWLGCVMTEGFVPESEDVLTTEAYFTSPAGFVTKDFPVAKVKEIYGIK